MGKIMYIDVVALKDLACSVSSTHINELMETKVEFAAIRVSYVNCESFQLIQIIGEVKDVDSGQMYEFHSSVHLKDFFLDGDYKPSFVDAYVTMNGETVPSVKIKDSQATFDAEGVKTLTPEPTPEELEIMAATW